MEGFKGEGDGGGREMECLVGGNSKRFEMEGSREKPQKDRQLKQVMCSRPDEGCSLAPKYTPP